MYAGTADADRPATGYYAARKGLYTASMDEDGATLAVTGARPPEETGPEALLAAVAGRDEAAFAAFYDATSSRAYALILRITQSAALAEEVMADVYLQVWQQAQRFDAARGSAQAWLCMLCRSRALDCLRRREPAETHADPDGLRDETVGAADPLDLLVALDRTTAIHAAVAQLGEVERQLLALAFFRGLTHQEIAAQTGMPLGTVKSVLRKTLLTLRDRLGRFAPIPESFS